MGLLADLFCLSGGGGTVTLGDLCCPRENVSTFQDPLIFFWGVMTSTTWSTSVVQTSCHGKLCFLRRARLTNAFQKRAGGGGAANAYELPPPIPQPHGRNGLEPARPYELRLREMKRTGNFQGMPNSQDFLRGPRPDGKPGWRTRWEQRQAAADWAAQ